MFSAGPTLVPRRAFARIAWREAVGEDRIAEMALYVLAYNMKRVMRILGIGELMAAMRA